MAKTTAKPGKPTDPYPDRRMLITGAIAIVLLMLIAYIPAMRAGYVWDDDKYVTQNPLITASDGLHRIWFSTDMPSQYFPLVYTMFRAEHALWGFDPAGYHITNILLHALNALLLWWLLRRLRVPGAWLAAAIWALHPVNVESVTWITERKNTLSTAFFLGTLLASLRFMGADQRGWWKYYLLGLVFCALALFAKTTACVLPAALLVVHWLRGRKVRWREALQIVPFTAMGLAMGLVSVWWEQHHQGTVGQDYLLSWADRVLIAGRALWFYLIKLILPVKLTFSYPQWHVHGHDPAQYLWPAAWIASMVLLWRWRPKLGYGPLLASVFFAAVLSPMLGFINLYTFRYTYVADHYQYVACIAPIALFAAFLSTRRLTRHTYRAIAAVVLMGLAVLTYRQSLVYTDAETLWHDVLAKNERSWLAHNNLANLLDRRGDTDEAMRHYFRVVELNRYFPEGQLNLAAALVAKGRLDEAVIHYTEALTLEPDWPDAHYDLGVAFHKQGKLREAIGQYQQAFRLKPDYADAYNNAAIALISLGKLDGAARYLRTAVEIQPSHGRAHGNLAVALYYKGDYAGAWHEVELAQRYGAGINPDFLRELSTRYRSATRR